MTTVNRRTLCCPGDTQSPLRGGQFNKYIFSTEVFPENDFKWIINFVHYNGKTEVV